VAIHARVAELLPLDKIAKDWFFESDVLFRSTPCARWWRRSHDGALRG
jgi:hypothetical protein